MNETFYKGLMCVGLGVVGIVYDWLRYSMRSEKKMTWVRWRLLGGSWLAIVIGVGLTVVSFLEPNR